MKLDYNTILEGELDAEAPTKYVKINRPTKPPRNIQEARTELAIQGESKDYPFTYNASRHEQGWLLGSLGYFYEQQWFVDVLRLVKGGKEASVYLCEAHPNTGAAHLAAKVYRPRMMRNLKNDTLYREGRVNLDSEGRIIHDDNAEHAMAKRTAYGKQLLHSSWIAHEVNTMQLLSAAGADVPRVYASGNNAILMSYIGEPGEAAPVLNSLDLERDEAEELFQRVVKNIEIMLGCNRIHGDLSAYNILYWDGEITLIDFPQAIHPDQNRSAYRIFERDVTRICEYFARQGVEADPQRLAADIWHAHHRQIAPQADPALLDAEDEKDMALWRAQQSREV